MTEDRKRLLKLGLFAVVVGLAVGAGVTYLRGWFGGGPGDTLRDADKSYQQGVQALTAGSAADAVRSFDEAQLLASRALELFEEERQKGGQKPEEAEQMPKNFGKAFWIKACALRDRAYAQSQVDGKPLTETLDSSSGEKFRNLLLIPDARDRGEALACLRRAAALLPGEKAVQNEALRAELMIQPYSWSLVETFSKQLIELEPGDTRALYMLALYQLEQPRANSQGGTSPTPEDKRSRSRVLEARGHVAKIKAQKDYPLWRTLHLEARIDRWLREEYLRGAKLDQAAAELKRLETLLLDGQDGALARAGRGEGIQEMMSSFDTEGVFGLHALALDLALERARGGQGPADQAGKVLDQVLAACQKMSETVKGQAVLAQSADTALAALEAVQPLVKDHADAGWKGQTDRGQALLKKALEGKVGSPELYRRMAALLAREAHVLREEQPGEAAKRLEESRKWVEDGLSVARETKQPAGKASALHMLAVDMMPAGGKDEDVAPHLEALKADPSPRSQAYVQLLEATRAERSGRLQVARSKLEQVLTANDAGLILRARSLLAHVYLALGQPEQALFTLNQVSKVYDRLDQLPAGDRKWALELLRSPAELRYLLVVANLQTASQRAAEETRKKPGAKVPFDLVKSYEETAEALIRQLPQGTPENRAARLTLARYLIATGRAERAEEDLKKLRREYPDNLGVLRQEVALLARPKGQQAGPQKPSPEAIKAADEKIRQLIAENPKNTPARLYWAQWLAQTDRAAEAIAYLENPASFPGKKDDVYHWLLAAAYLKAGKREEGARVLRHLPESAATSALLITLASSREEKEKRLQDALARHERNGLFRCWDAQQHLQRQELEEAARGFFQALEFSQVRSMADAGLRRALIVLGGKDPRQARELALEMLKEAPGEPTPLLGHAYACLMLDELGDPADRWEKVQNMASALNEWERRVVQADQDRVSPALTKAEFWSLANRADHARTEVVRALGQDPRNERVLRLGILIAVETEEDDHLAWAEKQLATLKEVAGAEPRTAILEGRLKEKLGRPADAALAYELALTKNPKESEAYIRLFKVLERDGGSERMEDWLKRWREQLPDDPQPRLMEVHQRARAGKKAEAQTLAEKLVADEVERARKELEGQKAPAETDPAEWEKQQQARLAQAEQALRLRVATSLAGAMALDEAEVWVRRVLADDPKQLTGQMLRGDLLVKREAWKEAADVYRAVLAQAPGHFVAGNNLAWILGNKLGDVEAAYKLAQELRRGRFSGKPLPGDRLRPAFLDTLGSIYGKVGRPEAVAEMRQLFEAARGRYPNDPRVYLYLGTAYAALDNPERAGELLGVAIALAGSEDNHTLSDGERRQVLEAAREAQEKLKQP